MILPIIGYGDPVLRKVGENISAEHPNLKETIANMYETMYNAYGVISSTTNWSCTTFVCHRYDTF
jgi:peptide deformylase